VPTAKATTLKNGTQVCSGRNFCAKARVRGDTTQLTFMTGMKPAFHVAWTWWNVLAPAMMAIDTRYTVFWIGAIFHQFISIVGGPMAARTYDQVAGNNLKNLSPQTGAARKQLLKNADQDVAHRCADESPICSHLWDARSKVVAILIAILCNPRREQLLQTRQPPRCQHLGPERIRLKLPEIGL
jgi:hypothetical protein